MAKAIISNFLYVVMSKNTNIMCILTVIIDITIINNIISFHVKSNRNILYTEGPYFAMIPAPPVPVG